MKTIRAKFRIENITLPNDSGRYLNIEMRPVYSEDPGSENKAFWDATPSGYFQMSCKPEAIQGLVEGQEVYIDIVPLE